ncbi:MAG: hypothetical protein ACKVQV_16135 [Bacteroidia bacterium]
MNPNEFPTEDEIQDNKTGHQDESTDKRPPIIIDQSETYKRIGFYTATLECGNKYELDHLIAENLGLTQKKVQETDARFRAKIESNKNQLKDRETRLSKEREAKETTGVLENKRKELVETFIKLGEEKRDLIEKRLLKFNNEISMFFKAQDDLYQDWRRINKKMYDDNKPGIDIIKKRVETCQTQFEQRYKGVQDQLIEMDKGGVDTLAYRYLLGHGMTLVAGWFFSVYLLIESQNAVNLGQDDVWFFLINNILSALSINPWIALGQVFLFLGILGLTALFSHVSLYRLNKSKNNQNFDFNIEKVPENDEADYYDIKKSFQLSVKSDSFYGLFLSALPVVMGLGLLFIAIRMGLPESLSQLSQKVEQLDISIAGQLMGTVLAYTSAAIVYLFAAKVSEIKRVSWINYTILIMALVMPCLFFSPLTPKHVALIGFIYALVMAAIPIAFGIRYRGLRGIAEYLNAGLNYFSKLAGKYSTPYPVNLFSKNFRVEAQKMEEELLDWIRSKNQGVRNMQEAPVELNHKEKKEKFVRRMWNDFLESLGLDKNRSEKSGDNSSKDSLMVGDSNKTVSEKVEVTVNDEIRYRVHNIELDAFEKNNFPDYDKKISGLKHEYDEIRTQSQVSARRLTDLEREIDEITRRIFDLQYNNTRSVNDILMQNMAQKLWLMEGFELGLWYIKNNIFPQRDCPPVYRPSSPDRPRIILPFDGYTPQNNDDSTTNNTNTEPISDSDDTTDE